MQNYAPWLTQQPRSSVESDWDGSYHFPTDAEMLAAICHALEIDPIELRDGRRMRRVNHIIQLVHVYHRLARATGATGGLKKRAAVAAALWPDVHSQLDMKRKIKIMLVWERIAEHAGLLHIEDGRGARALRWQLLSDWRAYTGAQRGCSSVGKRQLPAAPPTHSKTALLKSAQSRCHRTELLRKLPLVWFLHHRLVRSNEPVPDCAIPDRAIRWPWP